MGAGRRMLMAIAVCSVAATRATKAQGVPASTGASGAISGRVLRQADGVPVAGADVSLGSLGIATKTDSGGRFHLRAVPPGLHAILVRQVGYSAWEDTVTAVAGSEITRIYSLTTKAPVLDTVRTVAGKEKYISPSLKAFEERRLSHQGGYFISDSVFRANENSTLANVLGSRMPGLMLEPIAFRRLPVSTRKQCQGPVLLHSCSRVQDCWVAVYLDGQLFFNVAMSKELPIGAWPDFDKTFNVSDLAGAEYYPDAASAPAGMHEDDDGCGSLWLWTREH